MLLWEHLNYKEMNMSTVLAAILVKSPGTFIWLQASMPISVGEAWPRGIGWRNREVSVSFCNALTWRLFWASRFQRDVDNWKWQSGQDGEKSNV